MASWFCGAYLDFIEELHMIAYSKGIHYVFQLDDWLLNWKREYLSLINSVDQMGWIFS